MILFLNRDYGFFSSFQPKKRGFHEETTQNALGILPMGWGCSVGSLTDHN
jgi:hypothetical protein